MLTLTTRTFTIAPAAMTVGFIVASVGKYRWSIWAGWFLATLGSGLQYMLDVHTSIPAWIFINIIGGLGIGMLYPALAYGVQASSSDEDMAYAATLASFFRNFGQTIGVAIAGSIFQNQLRKELLKHAILASKAVEYSRDSTGLVEIIKAMPHGPAKEQLVQSYADALKYVWLVSCICAGIALIASLWTRELPIDRELATDQGFKYEEKATPKEQNEA